MERNENAANEIQQQTLPQNEALQLYATASTLKLEKDESDKLTAAFDDSLIEIRPDGHIYLPQTYFRERLNQTLGIGQWGLVTKGSHKEVKGEGKDEKVKLFLNGVLVIRGCFVAEAVGEAELHADNVNQSIGTCWESAKSDCITRCCKDLSIATQTYQPTYVREWQKKYAIAVWVEGKTKPQWRRIDAQPFFKEIKPVDAKKPFGESPISHPDKNKKWLNRNHQGTGGTTGDWIRVTQGLCEGKLTVADITNEFRVNKPNEQELFNIARIVSTYNDPKINARYYIALGACIYKHDVDTVATENKAAIEKDQSLRELFLQVKKSLPAKLKTA